MSLPSGQPNHEDFAHERACFAGDTRWLAELRGAHPMPMRLLGMGRPVWTNAQSDSTWPWSQDLLAEHQADLRPGQRDAIRGGNVTQLVAIDRTMLATATA